MQADRHICIKYTFHVNRETRMQYNLECCLSLFLSFYFSLDKNIVFCISFYANDLTDFIFKAT